MNYKVIITAVSIVVSLSCFSQVPGYMGKRCVILYDNYFSPTFAATAQNKEGGINTTHCLNMDYVIKQRTNFCLSGQYFKTGVIGDESYYVEVPNTNGGGVENVSATYMSPENVPMQLQSYNLGIGFKFFGRAYVAPVGKYQKLELLLLFSRLTYKKDAFYSYGYGKSGTYGTGDYSYNNFAFTYTLGRQHILFDKIVIDMGTRVGFAVGGLVGQLDASNDYYGSSTIEEDFKSQVAFRILRHQLINFHIGIGFLAF
ncbi:MAG: hypothetical protein V4608_08690 [Bacteroidota bacterium]